MDYKNTSKLFLKHARLDLATAQAILQVYHPNYDASGLMRPLDLRWNALYHTQQAYEKGAKAFLYAILTIVNAAFVNMGQENQAKLKVSCPYAYSVFFGEDGLSNIEPKRLNHDLNLFATYMSKLGGESLRDFFAQLVTLLIENNSERAKKRGIDVAELEPLTEGMMNQLSSSIPKEYDKIKEELPDRNEQFIKTHEGGEKYFGNTNDKLIGILECLELILVTKELYPFESSTRYGLVDGYFKIQQGYLTDILNGRIERLPYLFEKLDAFMRG